MATRKQKGKGKGKATVSKESNNGGADSSTRARLRTPSPTPPNSPASPPSTPPSPSSPHNPNTHRMTAVEERAWMGRKPRSNSMGKFGEKKPNKPTCIDIHGGRIFDDTAKKTLLAIIRDQLLYLHLRGQSRFEATYSIEEHVKRTCKRMMNEEKDRLKKKMKETGLPANDLRPSYFHSILWDQLVKYWNSEVHKHKSEVVSNNRKKVSTLHSAGAKSFEAIEMEMTKENKGKRPRCLQLRERTHTMAASRKAKKG